MEPNFRMLEKVALEHLFNNVDAEVGHYIRCGATDDKTIVENLETGEREAFCNRCKTKIGAAWPVKPIF